MKSQYNLPTITLIFPFLIDSLNEFYDSFKKAVVY